MKDDWMIILPFMVMIIGIILGVMALAIHNCHADGGIMVYATCIKKDSVIW